MSKVKSQPATQAKNQPPAPAAKAAFDPKQWAKNGVTEDEVAVAKVAFDLFDSDQGGSVDIKGIVSPIFRAQGRHDLPRILDQESGHLPDDLRS